MNRAAEAAVPQARPLLVNAVKSMSVEDAKGILTGGSDSATQYFRSKTQDALAVKFKPIIAQEELAIRKDPLGQSSKLLQKVFGMIGK